MSLRFIVIALGLAHAFALLNLSKDLQSVVSEKFLPRDLVKMRAVDRNWRGEGIFERIVEVDGFFVHRETREIMLETKDKLWTESELETMVLSGYEPGEFKNLIETKNWNELFLITRVNADQYWKEALAKIVDVKNKYGQHQRTMLMTAVMHHDDFKIVQIFLERGADVNTKNIYGFTPLHFAALLDSSDVIKLLLDFKAEINATDEWGRTPLMTALLRGNLKAAKVLLEFRACPNVKRNNGWTALDIAAVDNNIEAINLLLHFKAKIDAVDEWKETSLMKAVKYSSSSTVETLLECGARLDLKNDNNETALDIAKARGHQQIIWIIKLFESQQNKVKIALQLQKDQNEAELEKLNSRNAETEAASQQLRDKAEKDEAEFKLKIEKNEAEYKLKMDELRKELKKPTLPTGSAGIQVCCFHVFCFLAFLLL